MFEQVNYIRTRVQSKDTLRQNPAACRDAGITFIGPTPEAITLMGSKTAARQVAIQAGVPVVPGTEDPLGEDVADAEVLAIASRIGYPLMLKAVAGGGGKGMRMVVEPADLPGALRAARSEAGSAFGDAAVYLERRILAPRHIEVQLLADHHGTVIPFVERECSIQRRHQKVVEESPSPVVTADLRGRMFRPFARASNTTDGGLGLGLVMVDALARAQGAHVSYRDAAPGASFSVTFPAAV